MLTGYAVLLIAEDAHLYRKLGWVLEHKGCKVQRTGPEALQGEGLQVCQCDLILTQINGDDAEKLAALRQIKKISPRVRMILCSREGESAFPLEAYQLEVDDYLLMPLRLAEIWRRVVTCLKSIPGKAVSPAAANWQAQLNRTVLEKFQQVCSYFHYNLGSSRMALAPLLQEADAVPDKNLRRKVREVSARLMVMQELTGDFAGGIAGINPVLWARPDGKASGSSGVLINGF